ncbi:arsenate reductase (glutaredoxin) [Stenotrophomonas sp. YAU14D1_LEIMI4_1]|uniref:arsenate reductase (glutaredoxin) n=1 Tax=Stenotrophomonas sp. YAU14D1_LEIMI4_1 TaxID=2072407 RepID=UPI000D540BD4|nr:arsenate reductase (glutaredoxin) [Stenotrophomonas sp. YAU14D1_LEIMI4_1]AWH25887.1 arsenate reductase (glutaredoxin) [Stenotrophomonas sp. YAU14D1_LEIMI4_1]
MSVTIWHNPACSNSRGALALIRDAGIEPVVVDYLSTPPGIASLRAVLAESGLSARELVRSKEAQFAELDLADADDATLLAAMAEHPRLINRPVVRTPKGTRLCRPPETVLELL